MRPHVARPATAGRGEVALPERRMQPSRELLGKFHFGSTANHEHNSNRFVHVDTQQLRRKGTAPRSAAPKNKPLLGSQKRA